MEISETSLITEIESQAADVIEKDTSIETETLNEIQELQSLNVWGEHQEVLEEQALKELEIFAEENRCKKANKELEEGEISDDSSTLSSKKQNDNFTLEDYIKRQEELKKHQDYKRSVQVSEHSNTIAENVSKNHNQSLTTKILKRKNEFDNSKTPSKKKKVKHNKHIKDNETEDASGSEYAPSDDYNSASDNDGDSTYEKKVKQSVGSEKKSRLERVRDDGCLKLYKSRLNQYYKQLEDNQVENDDSDDIELQGGLKVPVKLWNNLYSYQQKGVEWLWKIHQQTSGGLLGDEMGLGKTVQIIVFLASLEHSHIISNHGRFKGLGPTLIVSPATVVHQWVKHFHEWAPEFRVAVLHQSGSYTGNKTQLIRDINKNKGILITTYSGILKYRGSLSELSWHYVILDEGHKIRNSAAKVSITVKKLQTPYRLMLTGSPMQNNLQELWSLFDFIVPGMLGTLSTFMEHFANPIMQGGYANATPMQEATALSVATALKNIISPYLLRRSKNEVKKHIALPNKSEQVLFCSLTDEQRDFYKGYLMCEHVSMILGRGGKNWFSENQTRANVLVAITTLRKICNHPDLYSCEGDDDCFNKNQIENLEDSYGYYKRSGKMVVVSALLKIWKKQKHRVLLFTQSRAMITIFEQFLSQQGYKYLKMDGSTNISSRQPLIDKFNQDSTYDVFLLTTRVGGLGVNLTGANRVIIYDPDWNPATDTQARERAWRIGQEKQVTVYRLISAGTIEEKMYQRQVWKQLLSNKVLLDPKTQKFFKTSDLHDLFSLQEHVDGSNPETANIFRNSRVNLQERINSKKHSKTSEAETSTAAPSSSSSSVQFSDEKIQAMKDLAQQIAKSLGNSGDPVSEVKKTPYQKELEEERAQKLKEKAYLKTLTPTELRILNRKRLNEKEDTTNTIDDYETNVSFSNALVMSEKTSKLYHDIKSHKLKSDDSNCVASTSNEENSNSMEKHKSKHKKKKSKHKDRDKIKIDMSGTVDGEAVEGLLKREIKSKEKHKSKSEDNTNEEQDNYVLEKLFSRKGVHGALQHDEVVQSGCKDQNKIKIHWEAQQRTDLALQALRKSRLDNWRW